MKQQIESLENLNLWLEECQKEYYIAKKLDKNMCHNNEAVVLILKSLFDVLDFCKKQGVDCEWIGLNLIAEVRELSQTIINHDSDNATNCFIEGLILYGSPKRQAYKATAQWMGYSYENIKKNHAIWKSRMTDDLDFLGEKRLRNSVTKWAAAVINHTDFIGESFPKGDGLEKAAQAFEKLRASILENQWKDMKADMPLQLKKPAKLAS